MYTWNGSKLAWEATGIQSLSFAGTTLSISDGNSVDLSALDHPYALQASAFWLNQGPVVHYGATATRGGIIVASDSVITGITAVLNTPLTEGSIEIEVVLDGVTQSPALGLSSASPATSKHSLLDFPSPLVVAKGTLLELSVNVNDAAPNAASIVLRMIE